MSTDAKLNRQLFQSLIGKKEWTAKEFHKRWKDRYGFTMQYNNFMELINNNVSWKLVYALSMADMLGVDVNELFNFIIEQEHQQTL